jgi:hypothetical protein
MVTCPWCGTNYLVFQPNCNKCGGPLQMFAETFAASSSPTEDVPAPPSAPRPISDKYVWRLLFSDGWAIAALVFVLLGVIFSFTGAGLVIGIITAFVGLPMLLLGLVFLVIAGTVLYWRYNEMQKIVNVLKVGEATRGQVVEAQENYSVEINGRNPWVIRYQFQVNGQDFTGNVSTLNPVGDKLQAGKTVWVLYLPTAPQLNSIYPHP